MTPLAIRMSRRRNGVSRLHGEVARRCGSRCSRTRSRRPITHVTNGAHLPTFVSAPMRLLFDRHLGDAWLTTSPAAASAWEGVWDIPNSELWAARCQARALLVDYVRAKAAHDSLLRGEQIDYVRQIETALDPDALTLGFARRLATYKRLYLLTHDPERARRIFRGERAAQLVVAGQGAPQRRGRQGRAAAPLLASSAPIRRSRAGSSSSRTTTSASPRSSSPAATSGSTCRAGRWRRAGRAA